MASISKKKIKGIKYTYLIKSIRLPDGRVKTISKLLKNQEKKMKKSALEKRYKEYFMEKEKASFSDWAAKRYKNSYIFPEDQIRKIEQMRVGYKHIIKKMDKRNLKDITDRFAVNFTYDSNAIEGSSLTLKDVEIIITKDENIPGKDLREIYETKNSRKIIEMIFNRKFKIRHEDIIKMHKILMKNIDEGTGYKKLPNVIFHMEREVSTVPPENVKKEMTKLIEWYENSIKSMHPLETAIIFHGKFEQIHPFTDGNGRVGRFLINSILVNNGYPPLIVRKSSRTAYMNALSAFDKGHDDSLKRFILRKFKDTYKKFFEVYVKYA